MIAFEEARRAIQIGLEASTADETEVVVVSQRAAFARFAAGLPTQDGDCDEVEVAVRVRLRAREARATAGSLDAEAIRGAVERAVGAARARPGDPEIVPLAGPASYSPKDAFAQDTVEHAFAVKAAAIAAAREVGRERDALVHGLYETRGTAVALGNSRGCFAEGRASRASFAVTATCGGAEGWAAALHADASRIDPRAVAGRAVEKAVAARAPRPFPPRRVRVVLEPAALSNLLFFAATNAFGARAVEEGGSFVAGKFGESVLDPRVSIDDDLHHPLHGGVSFDFEGTPVRRVPLVERGVARGVVHDRRSAAKAGVESTGHALPQPSETGPFPARLVFGEGEATLEEMIASSEEAILVTRFHYTNLIEPVSLRLTGVTRSGTFLVRDGVVEGAVRNLRFTESLVEALRRVVSIGRERVLAEAFFGGEFVVPAIALEDYAFTGAAGPLPS